MIEPPTHRPPPRRSEATTDARQVRDALSALASQSGPSSQLDDSVAIDFDEAVQPLLEAVAQSEIVTTEDLAVRINTRE